jgi:spermidine synthase
MAENPWIPLLEITGTYQQLEELAELDAEEFLNKAHKAADSAQNEITYGETISDLLANESEIKECHRSLATIGVWHFECSVELFNKAIRNFERAKKRGLSKELQKEVEVKIKDCRKQLVTVTKQKDSATDLLNSLEKSNKKAH